MTKYVYAFEDGKKEMKDHLGGKGANLAEMTNLGISVPPGFTITTDACGIYYENKKQLPEDIIDEIKKHVGLLEKKLGKKLGDNVNPLLVSVRSGAAVSMPGMMDTVLNLGLNDTSIKGLIKKTKNERFAWDAYRRFINMFGDVVMEIPHHKFEEKIDEMKKQKGVDYDTDLNAEDLKTLVEKYKDVVKKETGRLFPSDPFEQLLMSVRAVFGSWNNSRAIAYRRINEIKGLIGTAVNVQAMVFGNMGNTSGTGVFFTRNPSTGVKEFYGEYLVNAQGEDVVAGIRTPRKIEDMREEFPRLYDELVGIYKRVEKHYRDMQDMEFTFEEEKLFILQTRSGKRTAQASVKIAVDMVGEGLIDKKTAILRINPKHLDQLLHKQFDPVAINESTPIASGLPASPGAAVGCVVFDAETAKDWTEEGKKVILVRIETSPEDIEGMHAAQGILTSRGGMTSHAAVVARGMGTPCVAGCEKIKIDYNKKEMVVDGVIIKEDDFISINGATGKVYKDKIRVVDPELSGEFEKLMSWADEYRKLNVRTNADTPGDAKKAIEFGAEGIGLCRTEHMFFEGERIKAMREMILSADNAGRKKALGKLLPYQKSDFKGIFQAMDGRPVTIRLLDPPLHEFLPQKEEDIEALADEMKVSVETVKSKISSLHEFNPMLGHRGCRLGITYPEITEMQARAIFEAAVEVGDNVVPEVMVPLVGTVKELKMQKEIIDKVAEEVMSEKGKFKYLVGTMIEVPRGALTADEIAEFAEFFSFGTNDLTQMTYGFSRDDAGKFLNEYQALGILENDPFQSIDQTGVGQLMVTAVKKGRSVKKGLKLGICGEHGGEPTSVEFCHKIGLNYVSCSPFRVPIARLAAAQAELKGK